jgi:hypothetical protein
MNAVPHTVWIAACAHALQQRWRTVDPAQLEEVADDLWQNERLRAMPPRQAAESWLEPVAAPRSRLIRSTPAFQVPLKTSLPSG